MDDEDESKNAIPDFVKHRKCPGCGQPLKRFGLYATSMPMEQTFIPFLRLVNKDANWSVRPTGTMNFNELQFLSFKSTCQSCSLMSEWDFSTEELEWVIENPNNGAAEIVWRYGPKSISSFYENLPGEGRKVFQGVYDAVAKKDEGK